jgi:LysR family glycine cleavage system transcriptional activator
MPSFKPPSTVTLRAFATAARLSSFTGAAHELSQTQSAVSHQIKELEEALGVQLFERRPRGIALTGYGRAYLPYVLEALDRLRAGAEALGQANRDRILNVSMSPNFAAKWLVPKLGAFSEAHPDLDLRISSSMEHVSFEDGDIDMAIRHGTGDWPHLHVRRLCAEELYPVCSPSLLEKYGQPATLDDLKRYVLLHDRDRRGWARWLRAFTQDLSGFDVERGPVFSQLSLAIDAAVAGQGIALARSALVALDLSAGRLVRPLPQAMPAPFAYWIVCPKTSASEPKVKQLTSWLVAEAERDAIGAAKRQSLSKRVSERAP